MEYYKYQDEYSEIAPGITYVEIDEGWTIRQVIFNGEQYVGSNVNYPHWGMRLPDQQEDFKSLAEEGEVTPIPKEEFEAIWRTHLAFRQGEWESAKQCYLIGAQVQGSIKLFYPQGVIVNLADNTLGLADYKACRVSTQPEFMYPHHKLTAVVSGYDEENQWIVLGSPQVHEEKVDF